MSSSHCQSKSRRMHSQCSPASNNVLNEFTKFRTLCQRIFFRVIQIGNFGCPEFLVDRIGSRQFFLSTGSMLVVMNTYFPNRGDVAWQPNCLWPADGVVIWNHGDYISGWRLWQCCWAATATTKTKLIQVGFEPESHWYRDALRTSLGFEPATARSVGWLSINWSDILSLDGQQL